jgi:hypothetical protein
VERGGCGEILGERGEGEKRLLVGFGGWSFALGEMERREFYCCYSLCDLSAVLLLYRHAVSLLWICAFGHVKRLVRARNPKVHWIRFVRKYGA